MSHPPTSGNDQPPGSPRENQRLAALRALEILDTPRERAFDDLTALVADICQTPIALITLIDESRQWFKAAVGIAGDQTPRETAFCAHALDEHDVMLVPDATRDRRFADNPYVTGEPHIRFYAGAPLVTPEGHTLGTLCVIDRVPRQLDERQLTALRILGRQVMTEMQLRRRLLDFARIEQALRQSEREQRALVQNLEAQRARLVEAQAVAKVGSWETDLVTLAVTWSEQTHRIFGTDPDTFAPTHAGFLERVHPEDRAAVDRAFQQSVGKREIQAIEHRILLPDGRVKFVEERWQVFYSESGQPVRAMGTCRDITERKTAEEERDRLFNQSLDLLCVAGFDGRLQQVNPAWTRCLGWTGAELTSRPMLDFVHPDDLAGTLRVRAEIHGGRSSRGFENRYRCKDGSYRWLSWNVHSLPELQLVFGVARDVTEQRQIEATLGRNEALLRMATKVSRLGAWQVELPGMKLTWSEEIAAIHEMPAGYTPSVAEGLDSYAPEFQERIRQRFGTCLEQGVPFDEELQLITAKGNRIWVRVLGEAVRDGAGRIVRVQGAFQDIAERKRAEDELRRMARRLTITLESITDAFFTLDHDWRFTYLNTEAERLLQRTEAALLGRNVWTEFPDAVGSLFQRQYERAVAEKVTVGFEAYYPPPLDRWFAVRAYPSEEGLAVYFQDITAARRAREDLRLSEERFREMADNIGDVFYNFDPVNNRLLYGSPAYEQIWGRPLAEVYANPLAYLDAIDPADRPVAEAAFARQLKGEETTVDFRVRHPDGSVRWVREHAVPVLDEQGRVERIVGTMRDISESRRASEELRRSEEQYRLLFASNPHPMWVFDLETLRILAVNAAAVSHYGYSEAEFLAMRVIDLRAPEDAIAFPDALAWLPPVGKATGTRRHRRKDGTVIDVEATSDSVTLAGRPARLALAHDVTERRRAEAKLREQAALLDKAQDAILVRDLSHHITYWNKSAERLYGWTAAEALGRNVRELLYFDRGIFDTAMAHLLAQGEWTGELVQLRKDGERLTIEGRWTLVRDEAGQPRAVLAINTDITERKKLEQQFLRAQRMESIGTLAGGIAHDLNNLLAPITMGVDLLKLFNPPPKSLPVIENIERSARRGTELVKQVLSFARGVEGARVTLQVRHILTEVEAIATNTFPKNITIGSQLPRDLWPVLADPTQLNQVVMNLCVNARDAMPAGGRLELAAGNTEIDAQYAAMERGMTPGRYVVIQVTDTGTGMPREIIDRIFEPFFTTKELGKGTGLGLSTVLGIVRSHGGFVNVSSEVGQGSTFKVYLPAHEAGDGPVGDHRVGEPLPRGRGELILVVDDEAAIIDITKQTLLAFGYRVVTAEDGAQAVSLYAQQRNEIALVLTDMMMPLMDGATLILALQRINPGVRVIAASGLKVSGETTSATHPGVKYFLPKPYSADMLLRLVRQVLDPGGSQPPF